MALNLKAKIYTDETAARKHLERIQWPDGPICPHCGVVDEATRLEGESTRPGVWKCRACEKPFSVTVGTIFERSHVPLTKWLLAAELLTASKKGISSHQLSRMLGVTYKTAWFMAHRIREAMKETDKSPMGGWGKTVEVDETYVGEIPGKKKNYGGAGHKYAVVSLVERGAKVRSIPVERVTQENVANIVRENVQKRSTLSTDKSRLYTQVGREYWEHGAVDHGKKEWARDDFHTNTLEGFFSVFKRGVVGTYQHISGQHLERYLAEFDFRYNNRAKLGIDDQQRAVKALEGIKGKRLTYRRTDKEQRVS